VIEQVELDRADAETADVAIFAAQLEQQFERVIAEIKEISIEEVPGGAGRDLGIGT
jgi:hypothetical protein